MKSFYLLIFFVFFGSFTLFAQTIFPDYYDGTIYLKIKDDANIELPHFSTSSSRSDYPYFPDILEVFAVDQLYTPFTKIKTTVFKNTYQVKFQEAEKIEQLIARLNDLPYVEYAEKIPIYYSSYNPNDPYADNTDQWFLSTIEAYDAWDLIQNGSEVLLAVVDDGSRWDHVDLIDNVWVNGTEYNGYQNFDDDGNGYVDDYIGWDAADWDNNPSPPTNASDFYFSHGTHCAGIAAGRTDNAIGIASISFNQAKIMTCKSTLSVNPPLGSNGSPLLTHAWEAFEYAAINNADIISCSWGGAGYSSTAQNLINWAVSQGSIVVAAAGNGNTSTLHYPAAYNNVIAVANTTPNDTRNSSSNYGTWVDISAPGTSILSPVATTLSSYQFYNGTSMACPMVAGLLALMKSQNPSASNAELVSCLFSSADNIDNLNPGYAGLLGAGRINAYEALICLSGGGTCDDPSGLYTSNITDATCTINWDAVSGADNYTVEFRASGENWYHFPSNPFGGTSIDITGLQSCTSYQFRVKANCGNNSSSFVVSDWFDSEGCFNCPLPSGISIYDVGYAYFYIDWDSATDADSYEVRYREDGTSTWTNLPDWNATSHLSGNKEPCAAYEWQVRSKCGSDFSAWSAVLEINTLGCGDPYCYSYGLTWDDWISRVQLGSINNQSGKNYGYEDYTNLSTEVEMDQDYTIRLTPATDDNSETVYWQVWIDYNQDEDFNDWGELVFEASGTNTQMVSGDIDIPTDAMAGTTRMRVSMSVGSSSTSCQTGDFREVEDYALQIEEACTVPSRPTLNQSGTVSFCEGQQVTLSVPNPCSNCTIEWSTGQTGNSITVANPGTYTAIAINDCGSSSASLSVTLVQEDLPSIPNINVNGSSTLCEGESTQLSASNICSGCTIQWSNGDNGSSTTITSPGTYTATAINDCGTSNVSNSITILAGAMASPPTIIANGSTSLCNGQSIVLSATNICNACTVNWSNGQSGNSITVFTPGVYSATSLNACGSSSNSNSVTVTMEIQATPPSITANGPTMLCEGETLLLSAANICNGCTVNWSTGESGNSLTVSAPGTYFATAVNDCGPSSNSNFITVSSGPVASTPTIIVNGATSLCEGESTVLFATNVCSGCTVNWSNGESGNSIIVSNPDTYFATAINTCGPSSNSNFITISSGPVAASPTVVVNGASSLCEGESTVLFASNVCNGCTVNWSNGESGNSITVFNPGTYFATSTNACGPSSPSNSVAITSGPIASAPTIITNGSTNLCPGESTLLSATNVCNGCTVNWSNGKTGMTIVVSDPGTYFATSTNDCGPSSSSNSISITTESAPYPPTIAADRATILCPGETIVLTASNVCNSCTINWSNGESGSSLIVSSPGTYSVTAVNACGVSNSSNTIVITSGILATAPTIMANGSTILCDGESTLLSASNICNACTVEWSTGESGNNIIVSSPGIYFATAFNECGASSSSNLIEVTSGPVAAPLTILVNGSTSLCPGESAQLSASNVCNGCTVEWSNGESGNSIFVTNPGIYTAIAINDCGASSPSNTITITVEAIPDPLVIMANGPTSLCPGETVQLSANNICSNCTVNWSNGESGTTITVANAGNYTATAVNHCGMQSTVSNDIEVIQSDESPKPILNHSDTYKLCEGDTLILQVLNPCSDCVVDWSNGMTGTMIGITNAGAYSATYTNDCGLGPSSAILMVSMTEFIPEISVNNQCYLAAPSGSDFQWFLNGTPIGAGQFWTAVETGYYTLSMMDEDGCEGISDPLFVEACPTGVKELENISDLQVFPNPAFDEVWLSFTQLESASLKIDLLAIDGRELWSIFKGKKEAGSHQIKIDVSNFASGLYLYRFVEESQVKTGRLVIQRE